MAIKTNDMYYRIINIEECLADDLHLTLRGFESEESFNEGKTNPEEGKVYIRFEKDYKYPKALYNQDAPLRPQIYNWLNQELEGVVELDGVL